MFLSKCHRFTSYCLGKLDFSKSCPNSRVDNGRIFLLQKCQPVVSYTALTKKEGFLSGEELVILKIYPYNLQSPTQKLLGLSSHIAYLNRVLRLFFPADYDTRYINGLTVNKQE